MSPLLVFVILSVGGYGVNGLILSPEEKLIREAVASFGHLLTHELSDDVENTLVSPFSVHSVLTMAMIGSDGVTRNDFYRNLWLAGLIEKDILTGYSSLLAQLIGDEGFSLHIANRLYIAKGLNIKNDYKAIVKSYFKADALNADFLKGSREIQKEINNFVNVTTKGLIKKILQTPLSRTTQVAVINALYFKGNWTKKFSEIPIKKHFNADCAKLRSTVTRWLTKTESWKFLDSTRLDSKLILLPYKSDDDYIAEMLIILPNRKDECKLGTWLKGIGWDTIKGEIKKMKSTMVGLTIPKFEIEARYSLQDVLPALGMNSPFDHSTSNFSLISDSKLTLSEVIHQTKLTFSKDGTEAAAATVSGFNRMNPTDPEVVMDVSRSFYFAIITRDAGSVLPFFTGIVNKVR